MPGCTFSVLGDKSWIKSPHISLAQRLSRRHCSSRLSPAYEPISHVRHNAAGICLVATSLATQHGVSEQRGRTSAETRYIIIWQQLIKHLKQLLLSWWCLIPLNHNRRERETRSSMLANFELHSYAGDDDDEEKRKEEKRRSQSHLTSLLTIKRNQCGNTSDSYTTSDTYSVTLYHMLHVVWASVQL